MIQPAPRRRSPRTTARHGHERLYPPRPAGATPDDRERQVRQRLPGGTRACSERASARLVCQPYQAWMVFQIRAQARHAPARNGYAGAEHSSDPNEHGRPGYVRCCVKNHGSAEEGLRGGLIVTMLAPGGIVYADEPQGPETVVVEDSSEEDIGEAQQEVGFFVPPPTPPSPPPPLGPIAPYIRFWVMPC